MDDEIWSLILKKQGLRKINLVDPAMIQEELDLLNRELTNRDQEIRKQSDKINQAWNELELVIQGTEGWALKDAQYTKIISHLRNNIRKAQQILEAQK